MLVGDAVADDVGVGLGAEAADDKDGDARELEPAGQLLPKGVLLRRDVQGVLVAGGAVQAEPVGHLSYEGVRARPGWREVDFADGVDQVGEAALAAGLGQLRGQAAVHRRRVRQDALGGEPVHHLPERDLQRRVPVHDLPRPFHDEGPPNPFTSHTGTRTPEAPLAPRTRDRPLRPAIADKEVSFSEGGLPTCSELQECKITRFGGSHSRSHLRSPA